MVSSRLMRPGHLVCRGSNAVAQRRRPRPLRPIQRLTTVDLVCERALSHQPFPAVGPGVRRDQTDPLPGQ
jgi:hypothetical protein